MRVVIAMGVGFEVVASFFYFGWTIYLFFFYYWWIWAEVNYRYVVGGHHRL